MRVLKRPMRVLLPVLAVGALATGTMTAPAVASSTVSLPASPSRIDCSNSNRFLCTEINQSDEAFGHYVGHDEPSVLFYSDQAGSGNQMVYRGVIPKEPPAIPLPGKRSFDFNLYAAFWYGMAMCDTQSYPETVRTCIPDSNANITSAGSAYHAGTAYMELQFYPPGYVQQWNGFSCSPTKWCVALNIDSYAANPVTGQQLNPTCQAKTGVEYVNFAYLTHSGVPQGPPNPVHFDPIASGTPDPSKVFFLNQGDHYSVTMHDTQHGLQTIVSDATTGQSGLMTASAANGFGQVKFAPNGTSCTNIPYDFHPMYSTATTSATVPWAAATYNVAFDSEVGHFDYCSKASGPGGGCIGTEGVRKNNEPTDGDDSGCWPASFAGLIAVTGCEGSNVGFDGTSYLPDWPDGNSTVTPSPTIFTSPLTGPAYNTNYTRVGFNTDLPAIESQLGFCNQHSGQGCSLLPQTDDNGAPAAFYPYYTTGTALGGCSWAVGQDVPGFTTSDFGQNSQYGQLLKVTYAGPNGTKSSVYNDYQNILPNNPCPSG